MLDQVAEEMLAAVLSMAGKASAGTSEPDAGAGAETSGPVPEVMHAAAHRWGMAFPTDGAFEAAAAAGHRRNPTRHCSQHHVILRTLNPRLLS